MQTLLMSHLSKGNAGLTMWNSIHSIRAFIWFSAGKTDTKFISQRTKQ